MLELIQQPWPWYVAGIFIGLTVPTLLIVGNKSFGISSNLRHICAACIPGNVKFFQYDWKKEIWNWFFAAGIVLGGFIAMNFLANPDAIQVADATKSNLREAGVTDFTNLLPADVFSWDSLLSLRGFFFMIVGGFLVGFGTRYAGGCTSGHAIMGLSTLQWPSLVATICFMIGGFISAWFIVPFLLGL